MLSVLYSYQASPIFWKLQKISLKQKSAIKVFNSAEKIDDIIANITQETLFDLSNYIYVIDIAKWRLNDKKVKETIKSLNNTNKEIYLFYEATVAKKSALLDQLKIKQTKVFSISLKEKSEMIDFFLKQNKLGNIDFSTKQYLLEYLPANYNFVKNEIKKLSLLNEINKKNISSCKFGLEEENVFLLIDDLLANKKQNVLKNLMLMIETNNNLISIIQIMSTKLFQIKMLYEGIVAGISSYELGSLLDLPEFVQKKYLDIFNQDILSRLSKLLLDLYNLDILVKKQKKLPVFSLINLLANF